jgi:hypothetical protein
MGGVMRVRNWNSKILLLFLFKDWQLLYVEPVPNEIAGRFRIIFGSWIRIRIKVES